MSLTIMNFGRIRDLVSNLGWRENNTYILGADCLATLKSIEEELLHEDVIDRNVHISLHICGTVKKDLIPILLNGKNNQILYAAIRVLVNLSLPVECLSPIDEVVLTNRTQIIRRQLLIAAFEFKKSFLTDEASFSLVAMLREAMIKSEKHNVSLTRDDCIHIRHSLVLLRNILHLPEVSDICDDMYNPKDWQFVQNKLLWNFFVQGLDAALLLMLNSKYRNNWTVPLTFIVAQLYRNQNITKFYEALELISSASDTSCDEEESDGSKNSSTSLSSELSKANNGLSDSGCALNSDRSTISLSDVNNCVKANSKGEGIQDCLNFDIHTKLEKVQINDFESPQHLNSYGAKNNFSKAFVYGEIDSESSSCSESPHHKRIKGSTSLDEQVSMSEGTDYSSKEDSGVPENMDRSSPDIQGKSSDEDLDKQLIKNFMAVQKLRSLQMHSKVLESDSSNEDMQNVKIKYRSHPPAGRRGKSPRRNNGCIPSICMDSAIAASTSKGRMKYPLWEKRNSVTTLLDLNSRAPSDEDIGNLIKEFTMSFLHSGFSHLVEDLKTSQLGEMPKFIDKSLLFWLISYFLKLAATVHLNIDHISNILNADLIGYLVYECVLACESVELHPEASGKMRHYIFYQMNLVTTALKEIMVAIDMYTRKSNSQKDKAFFSDLCGKLAHLQHLRHIPLLLLHTCCHVHTKGFAEDVIVLNHYILIIIEKGMEQFPKSKKINFTQHLKHFSTKNIVNSYGKLLENYKYNSNTLNECVFTMLHHIAGDVHASDLLLEPSILKSFSSILKEDIELEPYQEDLIMYVLNKFRHEIQKRHLKRRREEEGGCSGSSDRYTSSRSSSVNSNCLLSEEDDDLFWWYLQFEQDKDPIARISEHISTSKRDILSKLQVKGIITPEKYQSLDAKMKMVEERNDELLSCEDLVEMDSFDDEITHLLRTLVQSGSRQHLTWIQETLLEACFVKLGLHTHLPEPVPLYSTKMMTLVPLVPYTEDQRTMLKDEMFLLLLQKIGFYLGMDKRPMYPRIPLFWTSDVLFTIAARLGPMRKDKMKFSYEELLRANPNHERASSRLQPYPPLPSLSSCCTLSSWLAAVKRNKDDQKRSFTGTSVKTIRL